MLNITLDSESTEYLTEILTQENITIDELVKKLLHDRWLTLKQSQPSILERMGGHPKVLLQGSVDLSDRDVRKAQVMNKVKSRHDHRSSFQLAAIAISQISSIAGLGLGMRSLIHLTRLPIKILSEFVEW